MWRRQLALPLFALAACSDAPLYSAQGGEPLLPDRFALVGQLCTEDASSRDFPVKVLFVVDSSLEMFAADPSGYRFRTAPGSIDSIRQRYRNLPHVSFGFIRFSSLPRAVPGTGNTCSAQPTGQRFYRPQDCEIDLALNELAQPPTDNSRDIELALGSVESFIAADINASQPGEVLRTRYLVTFLTAGPHTGSLSSDELGQRAQGMAERLYARGVLELRVNTNMLYFGPATIDQDPSGVNYNCYPPGTAADPPCSCGGANGGPEYCGVYCSLGTVANWQTRLTLARRTYEAIAFAGGGLFREYGCAGGVDFNTDVAQTPIKLVKKDIVAFNRNVQLGPGGPAVDSDGDGLTDADERGASPATDPAHWDSDRDGIGDRVEFRMMPDEQNPMDGTDAPGSCADPAVSGIIDRDGDLLNDCEEGLLQSSASIPDSDGDGLPDMIEFLGGTVPIESNDRLLDYDGDGIANGQEVLEHTNPRSNDNLMRGTEGYRHRVLSQGEQKVPVMEPPDELRGIDFRRAAATVQAGQAYLLWNGCTQTLSWSDASYPIGIRPFAPQPLHIPSSGVYTLYAVASNGEQRWVELDITLEFMPGCEAGDVLATPLLTTPVRYCYDVKISNIKVMHTLAATVAPGEARADGVNSILVYFTQAPETRLASPGISKVAEVLVRYRCSEDGNCARNPAEATVELLGSQFVR